MRDWRLLLVTPLALGGCADLNPRATQICGNGIVEPSAGEDCDGGESCIAPGAANQCLWACEEGTPCPDGFGCGVDGACLAPSTQFERGPIVGDAATVWVKAADMDGDGRDDLVHLAGEIGQRQADLTVTFMGPGGVVEKELHWERLTQKVDVGDVDGDGLLDLVFVGEARLTDNYFEEDQRGFSVLHNDGARRFDAAVTVDRWRDVKAPGGMFADEPWFPMGSPHPWSYFIVDGDEVLRLLDDKVLLRLPALEDSPDAFASVGTGWGSALFSAVKQEPGPLVPGNLYGGLHVQWEHPQESPPTGSYTLEVYGNQMLPWVETAIIRPDGDSEDIVVLTRSSVDPGVHSLLTVRTDWPLDSGTEGFETVLTADWGRGARIEVLAIDDLNGDNLSDFIFTAGAAVSGSCPPDLTPDGNEWPLQQCGTTPEFPYCCTPTDATRVELWGWDDALTGDFNGDDQLDLVGSVIGSPDLEFIFSFQPNRQEYFVSRTLFAGGDQRELESADINQDGRDDILIRVENPGVRDDALKVLFAEQALGDPQTVLDGIDLHPGLAGGEVEAGAVAVSSAVDGLQLGIVSPQLLGGRLVSVPTMPPVGAEATGGSYQNFVAGRFTDGTTSTFALAGFGQDFAIGAQWPSLEAGRLDWNPGNGTFVRVSSVPWQRLPGEPFGDEADPDPRLTPELGPALSTMIAADLDGDGLDELVVAGPATPNREGQDAGSGGVLLVFRANGDRWELAQDASSAVAGESVGGDFPYSSDPAVLDASDVDGDGDLDIALTTRGEGKQSALLLVLNEGGRLAATASTLTNGGGGWQALTLLGPAQASPQRVAAVADDRLTVLGLDPEAESLTEQDAHDVPQGSKWADVGDFNGDGLSDIAVAGDGGVILFYGLPTHGFLGD